MAVQNGAVDPVFIVGVGRGGTSILYRVLQSHTRFRPTRAPNKVELTETHIFVHRYVGLHLALQEDQRPWRYLLDHSDQGEQLFRELEDNLRWQRHLSSLLNTTRLYHPLDYGAKKYPRIDLAWWVTCRNREVVQAFFRYAQQVRGMQRILEKTPSHVGKLDRLWHTYPGAQVICMTRNPLDVFASYRRRYKTEISLGYTSVSEPHWLKQTPSSFAKIYAEVVRQLRRVSRPDHRLLVVHYEELTESPAHTVEGICAFLGERYEPAMIHSDAPGLSAWKLDPLLAEPIHESTTDWNTEVSRIEAREIEAMLEKELIYLGYQPQVGES